MGGGIYLGALWGLWSKTGTSRGAFPHDENWLTKTANKATPKKEFKKKGGGGRLKK
jgi:hypothetical protein